MSVCKEKKKKKKFIKEINLKASIIKYNEKCLEVPITLQRNLSSPKLCKIQGS